MRTITPIKCAVAALILGSGNVVGQTEPEPAANHFVMIMDDLDFRDIELVELNEQVLIHRDDDEGWITVNRNRVLALHRVPRRRITPPESMPDGLLILTDGQTLPGKVVSNTSPSEEVFAWNHPWLGRLEVPLEQVSTVRLKPGRVLPREKPEEAEALADVVILVNGDRLEGIVVALGDPLVVEMKPGEETTIPLDRVTTIQLVSPFRPRRGTRVWFQDGTVVDVRSLRVSDDEFVNLIDFLQTEKEESGGLRELSGLRLEQVEGIQFPGPRLFPLASLEPLRISGPATRYEIPPPEIHDADAPLGLGDLELHGPLTVRYALPAGSSLLAATITLPLPARSWGDYELILRCDGVEVFRSVINAKHPGSRLNIPLTGSELTIELTEGQNGPIQDTCLFSQAIILKGES